MDALNISPDTYASVFSDCKPGEKVTGTFSGTVGPAAADGSYPVQLDAVTKDPKVEEEEVVEVAEEAPAGASPAAAAVLKKK